MSILLDNCISHHQSVVYSLRAAAAAEWTRTERGNRK